MPHTDLLRDLIVEIAQGVLSEKKRPEEKKEIDLGGRPRANPNTKFAIWVDGHKGGTEEVAKLLKISVPHVNKLAREEELPSFELAVEIQRVSTGKIPVTYWAKLMS